MGIKDILEKEKARPESADWRVINLFSEGKFFRAYEVSAWLYHKYINESYKLTHHFIKAINGSIIFLGFPKDKLQTNIPKEATIEQNDDKYARVVLPVTEGEADIDLAALQKAFEEWKAAQPIEPFKTDNKACTSSAEPRQQGARKGDFKATAASDGHPSFFSIAQELMAFSIEAHSPIECMLFLSDVKKRLAQIL